MPVSAIILAGGRGKRVGGQDKGLLRYGERTLIEHVVACLAPQVDELILSANRNRQRYEATCPGVFRHIVTDQTPDFPGPLAGIASALPACRHSPVLVTACDMPHLPENLLDRLQTSLRDRHIAIASVDGHHQLAMLIQASVLPRLRQRLEGGRRRLIDWVESESHIVVPFDEQAGAFANVNHLRDLPHPAR